MAASAVNGLARVSLAHLSADPLAAQARRRRDPMVHGVSVTDELAPTSVPPPGWTATGGGLLAPPPGAATAPSAPVASSSPSSPFPAAAASAPGAPLAPDAAVRWRLRAARIDHLLVLAGYLGICVAAQWNPALPIHLLLAAVLGVLYHLTFEARDGQTPGKRRAGIRVVMLDDRPPSLRAIAIRSLLRTIDGLPVAYASGLLSMLRTGRERRQRIGDVVAGTKVIAVDRGAAQRGTPGWFLPVATLFAVLASVVVGVGAFDARTAPLSDAQRADVIAACAAHAPAATCECILTSLQATGDASLDRLNGMFTRAQVALATGRRDLIPAELRRARATCGSGRSSATGVS